MGTNEFMKKVYAYFNSKQEKGIQLTDEEQELMMVAEGKTNSFPISCLSFDDIASQMKIKNPLPDNVMEVIAQKMGNDYCEQLFWIHLPIITEIVINRFGLEVEYENEKKAINIVWDTDGEETDEIDLPEEVNIPSNINEEDIADYLSDEYGYCVESFELMFA